MNAHTQTAFGIAPAVLAETRPCVFDLRLNANASFLVPQEGARYEILLPGLGRLKAWNRSQVERLARDYYENPLPEEVEEDA